MNDKIKFVLLITLYFIISTVININMLNNIKDISIEQFQMTRNLYLKYEYDNSPPMIGYSANNKITSGSEGVFIGEKGSEWLVIHPTAKPTRYMSKEELIEWKKQKNKKGKPVGVTK